MGFLHWLNALRLLLCLFFLSIASLYDIKTREIPDRIWIIFAPVGSVLTLLSLILSKWNYQNLIILILSISSTICMAFILFYLGMFGGADAKALICLAIAMPTFPEINFNLPLKPILPMLPISVLNNSILLASSLVLVMISKNLLDVIREEEIFKGLEAENFITKFFAFITGFRVDAKKLRSEKHHYIVLEEFNRRENGVLMRRLKLLKSIGLKESEEQAIKIPEEFNEKIWVTMGLPFLVFITLGFLTAIFIGDIIFWLVMIMFS